MHVRAGLEMSCVFNEILVAGANLDVHCTHSLTMQEVALVAGGNEVIQAPRCLGNKGRCA